MHLNNQERKIVEENIGLVDKVIKDWVHNINGLGSFTYNDVYQVGYFTLCKAANEGRLSGESSTYAYVMIRNAIFTSLKTATRKRNKEITTDPNLMSGPAADSMDNVDMKNDLYSALEAAEQNAGGVVKKGIQAMRLMAMGYTSGEIGAEFNVPANNVTAWISKSRKYLRSIPAIAELRNYL